jgi:parallel beta-helix repeat protein
MSRKLPLLALFTLLILLAGCDNSIVAPDFQEADVSVKVLMGTSDLTLAPGDTAQIHVTLVDQRGNPAGLHSNGKLQWSSSNDDVATVDDEGVVTAHSVGDAEITARSGPNSGSATVRVREREEGAPEIVEIDITPGEVSLNAVGQEIQLEAVVLDESGTEVADPSITWSSLEPSVATVDAQGKVKSKAVGIALITALAGGVSDTATVEVRQVVASVSISPSTATLEVGETQQFTASAVDSAGTEVRDVTFTWNSSNDTVASVDESGLATGLTTGNVEITAAVGNIDAAASITVDAAQEEERSGPSTWLYPGDDIQAAVDKHGPGTSFLLKAGVHRMQKITPRDGQEFVGEAGAVLNGAKLLTGWRQDGSRWYVEDRDGIRRSNSSGGCRSDFPRCQDPVELFINDEPMRHVASLSDVTNGTWYFDYSAERIYIGNDPTGKTVERSFTSRAFDGSARNVSIRNVRIEKYANRFQEGAIEGGDSNGWTIEESVITLNHGVGIRIGDNMRVRNSRINRNGQLGIGGVGDDVLVERNEIAYNNFAGVSPGWEAGGTKFVKTNRLIVRGNHVHHNDGKALWTDIDNINTLYEDNLVEDNGHQGIFHEISYDAVIRNNTVRRNGFDRAGSWIRASGIFIANSPNVEVYGNIVEDNFHGITAVQQDRGEGRYGPYVLRNLWVHDNVVRMERGRNGVARDDGDDEVFSSRGNNRFDRNTYEVTDTGSRWFEWGSSSRTWDRWTDYGQDENGRIRSR